MALGLQRLLRLLRILIGSSNFEPRDLLRVIEVSDYPDTGLGSTAALLQNHKEGL